MFFSETGYLLSLDNLVNWTMLSRGDERSLIDRLQ